MKFLKYFAFMAAVVSLASCGNDEKIEYNDAQGVTVSMEKSEISYMESRGIVNVPLKVTGDANGYITVTCTVEEVGSNPAMEDVHYLVTELTVNIAPEEKTGRIEVSLVDDRQINPDRTFLVKLVGAEGATIEGIAQTLVTIEDNDDKPYDRLAGVWYCKCESPSGETTAKLTINAYAPDEYGYGASYMVENLMQDFAFRMLFHYNEATSEGTLKISLPSEATYVPEDDTTYSINGVNDEFTNFANGDVIMTWNEDVSELYVVSAPMGDHANFYITDKEGDGVDYVLNVMTFTRDMPK